MAMSIQKAPDYVKHRTAVAAADTLATVTKDKGVNASGYKDAHIQVVPSGGANPTVAIGWWSEGAGKFVLENPTIEKAGAGVDASYEFTIQPKGRIFFVQVKTIAAGACDVYVSGFDQNVLV